MIRALPAGYNSGDTVYCYFSSYDSNGASVTISGLAVTDIEVYKNGSTTQRASDNGYTLLDTDGIDFDGSTGLQGFKIDTSDNSDASFWADGAHYIVWVDAITVDSQTVRLGFEFRLGTVLRSTTDGRKLDVSTGGEAGMDWANIGSPTTTVGLSGTTVKTATDVETDTQDIQGRLPAALGANGNIKADVRDFNGTAGTFASGRPEVNVSHFGGSAGTFSGGRPEVNASHWGGTAVASAFVRSNLVQILGTAPTEGGAGRLAGAFTTFFDVAAPVHTTASVNQTGDSYARIGSAGAGLTNLPWNASWDAEVQSEVDDALVAQNLDHLVKIAVDTNFATTVHLNSVIGHLADDGTTATFERADHSLEAIWTKTVDVQNDVLTVNGLVQGNGFTIDAINTKLGTPAGASLAADLAQIYGAIDTEIAAILAAVDTEIGLIKAKTDNLPADPADASDVAAAITAAQTKIRKYLQLLARKDAAIATDNATELTELNASGGSGAGSFDNTSDSEQALADAVAGVSGGGGGGDATLAKQEEILADLDTLSAAVAGLTPGSPVNQGLEIEETTLTIDD